MPSSRNTAPTRLHRSRSAPTSRTSSPTTRRRFSRTACQGAWRSSPVIRSGRRTCRASSFAASSSSRTRAGGALSLSSMPRLRDAPNGFNEWLICESIAWARAHGYRRVSLNFAPFAALLAPGSELSRGQQLQAATLRRLKGRFQLDNLLHFNRKFFPEWQRRFVVYERRRDLPRVGVAALAAEAYLPFQ